MRDGRIRVQVEEIGRLLAVIRRTESEVVQKVRYVQRTRVSVENLFASRVKTNPSLLGRPRDSEPEEHWEEGSDIVDSEQEVRYGVDFSDCWHILTCGTRSENEAEGGGLGRGLCTGGGGTAEPKASASIVSGAAGSRAAYVAGPGGFFHLPRCT